MNKTVKIEKLNSIRNEMTHIWGSAFILGGGSMSLLFNGEYNLVKYFFGILGFILTLLVFNAYFTRRIEMQKMLKHLEDD